MKKNFRPKGKYCSRETHVFQKWAGLYNRRFYSKIISHRCRFLLCLLVIFCTMLSVLFHFSLSFSLSHSLSSHPSTSIFSHLLSSFVFYWAEKRSAYWNIYIKLDLYDLLVSSATEHSMRSTRNYEKFDREFQSAMGWML